MFKKSIRIKTVALVMVSAFLFSGQGIAAPQQAFFKAATLRGLSASERRLTPEESLQRLCPPGAMGDRNRAILAAHHIDQASNARHRALIDLARTPLRTTAKAATTAAVDTANPFPTSIGATSSTADAASRATLIAAGQSKEALANIGIVVAAGGEGGRLLRELVAKGILSDEEADALVKPTIPISSIDGYSPLEIQLRTIAALSKKFGVDIPVCVAISPLDANKPIVEKFLADNDNFGIKNLTTVVQGVNLAYDPVTGEAVVKADGTPVLKPDGQAGYVEAMASGPQLKWFRERFKENKATDGHLLLMNGDNIIDSDFLFTIAGAAALNPEKAFIGFAYAFAPDSKYGRFCNVVRDGVTRCEVVEKGEVSKVAGLADACTAAGKIAGNSNTMLMRLDDAFEERVAKVVATPHALTDKSAFGKGVLAEGKYGEKTVDNVEKWITDFPGTYAPEEVATVSVDARYRGIKDSGVRAELQAEIAQDGRRALTKRAEELGVAVTFEDDVIVEIVPGTDLSSVTIGTDCIFHKGARVVIGANSTIGNGTVFGSGTTRVVPPEITRGRVIANLEKRLNITRVEAVRIYDATLAGARLMLRNFPGPVSFESMTNAKGDVVAQGFDLIMQLYLESQGFQKPVGEPIMALEDVRQIVMEEAATAPFITIRPYSFSMVENGEIKSVTRPAIYNTLYADIVFTDKKSLLDAEVTYLFATLSEDTSSYHMMLFLKGSFVRERYLAGQIKETDVSRQAEKKELLESAMRHEAIWKVIEAAAGRLTAQFPSAASAWNILSKMSVEEWSGLDLIAPDRKPFAEGMAEAAIDALHEEVKTTATLRVLWSISGIRAVMGGKKIFGALPLPNNYASAFLFDTVPTDAMKVIAATQADVYADLLTSNTDPEVAAGQFCDNNKQVILDTIVVPNEVKAPRESDQAGDADVRIREYKEKKYKQLRDDFVGEWTRTQKGKDQQAGAVLVSKDTRPTGAHVADVQVRTLLARGVPVEYAGTQGVCEGAVATQTHYRGCFIDTASHNPRGDNGLKPFSGFGEVFNPKLAPIFMNVVKGRLKNQENTRRMITMLNGVPEAKVKAVYGAISQVKQKCMDADWEYRKRVITGETDPIRIEARIEQIRAFVQERKLAIITDPNGGARQNAEFYRQVLGFEVIELNARPRVDMKNPLCPHTVSLSEVREEVMKLKAEAEKRGLTIPWFEYNDTDGDRVNKIFFTAGGESIMRPDMPQILFTMDAVSHVLDRYNLTENRPTKPVAIACNDATATLAEDLAERFGFIIMRTQTGEANVVDGMERVNKMTFGEAKKLDMARRTWKPGMPTVNNEVYVPRSLHEHGKEYFEHLLAEYKVNTVDDLPIEAIMGGEGSNGSDFTFQLLVRDPLNKIKMMLGFLDPVRGPAVVKTFIECLGGTIGETELKKYWELDATSGRPGVNIQALFDRIIGALPPCAATDTFSPGAGTITIPPTGMPEPQKRALDELLDKKGVVDDIRNELGKIAGINPALISYKPVSSDEICRIGWGAGPEEVAFGHLPRDGGYAVRFYVNVGGWEMPFGAIWIRESLTEIGSERPLGYSVVNPATILQINPNADCAAINKEMYLFMEAITAELAQVTIALAAKEIGDDNARESEKLQPSIASLPKPASGADAFTFQLARLKANLESLKAGVLIAAARSTADQKLMERAPLDSARQLYHMGRLVKLEYLAILQDQVALCGSASEFAAQKTRLELYMLEATSGEILTIANPLPKLGGLGSNGTTFSETGV